MGLLQRAGLGGKGDGAGGMCEGGGGRGVDKGCSGGYSKGK